MTTTTAHRALLLAGGPGSAPVQQSDTPGTVVYTAKHAIDCASAGEEVLTVAKVELETVVTTAEPGLVLASFEVDSAWHRGQLDFMSIFEPRVALLDGTLEVWRSVAQDRLEPLQGEFGTTGPNLKALAALDLSGLPPAFAAYRAMYYDAFVHRQAFEPIDQREFIGLDGRMDMEAVDVVWQAYETLPLNAAPHAMERWWAHASLSLILEALP